MLSLTVALLVTAALSLSFSSTRKMGILSIALLCFLFPLPVLALLLIAGGVMCYWKYW